MLQKFPDLRERKLGKPAEAGGMNTYASDAFQYIPSV